MGEEGTSCGWGRLTGCGFLDIRGDRSWEVVTEVSSALGVKRRALGRLLNNPLAAFGAFKGDELRGVGLKPAFCGMGANGSCLLV